MGVKPCYILQVPFHSDPLSLKPMAIKESLFNEITISRGLENREETGPTKYETNMFPIYGIDMLNLNVPSI